MVSPVLKLYAILMTAKGDSGNFGKAATRIGRCHGTRPYGQGRHLESGYWLWIVAIHHQHEDPQRPTESSRVYSIIPQLRTYGYIREAVSMCSRFPSSSSSALE
jgi:hypothetical protein